jgi:16S rRNA processing protein RimM
MDYKSEILLGRINRIIGNEGSVSVKLEKAFIDNIPEMESVFLEIDEKPVPFFISHLEYPGGDICKLKLDGYSTFDRLAEFNGCRVFLTSVPAGHKAAARPAAAITGFKVVTQGDEQLGTVRRVIDNPGQVLLELVSPDGREILVPFHSDLVIRSDRRKKLIVMDLPEGLAGLNR